MGDEQSYADLRRTRAERPVGAFLKAAAFPNGVEVTVVRVEVGNGYSANPAIKGPPVPVWVVTGKEFEGEKKLTESGFMSGKLEKLEIDDPTGRAFILAQEEYKGQTTFKIARAL